MNSCLNCNKPVKNKFCNVSCRNVHYNKTLNKQRKFHKKKYNVISGELTEYKVICNKCKKEFQIIERKNLFPKKEKYYCSRKCANSHVRTNESKNKTSNSLKGRSFSEEHKKKLSLNNKGGRVSWYEITKNNGQKIKVQGSYELRFTKILNNLDENWIKPSIWNKEHQFQWFDKNGKSHWYTPDFWSAKLQKYFEIKGFWKKDDEEKKKFVSSLKNVEIVYLNDLQKYEQLFNI